MPIRRIRDRLILAAVVLATACAAGAAKDLDAFAVVSPPLVDGKLEAWAGIKESTVDVDGLSVSAANDTSFVYLSAILGDEMQQAAALRRGLILWVDPVEEGEERVGLQFPPSPSDASGTPPRPDSAPDIGEMIAALPAEAAVLGGSGSAVGTIPARGGRAEVSAAKFGDAVVYEFRIPLEGDLIAGHAVSLRETDRVRLRLQIASPPRLGRGGEDAFARGGSGGPGGGPRGGRRGGGGPGGGGPGGGPPEGGPGGGGEGRGPSGGGPHVKLEIPIEIKLAGIASPR